MRHTISHGGRDAALALFILLMLVPSMGFSQVPQAINYQGSLTDDLGNPVNTTVNITFTLHDVDAGPGTILWTETQSVTVTDGQFSVQLGAGGGNPLDPALFEDPMFLGIAVGGDAEMTPRQELTAVGYAFRAKTVESDTLSALTCSAGQIPKFIAGIWACAADTDTNTNAATICPSGTFLNGDGSCDVIIDTNTNAATICAAGTFLNGDGSCDVITDTNTTYSAGSGLVLSGTTFSIAPDSITATQLAPNSVGTSELVDGGVNFADLHNNAKGVGSGNVLVIPAAAFSPENDATSYRKAPEGYISPFNRGTYLCILAPAQLPNGVTVTRFEIIAYDNSASENITMELRKGDIAELGIGNFAVMATATSTGALSTVRTFDDNTISSANVNAADNQYFVSGCWRNDGISLFNPRLYAARITYN